MNPSLEFGRAWEYAPSLEVVDPSSIPPRWDLCIGGRWRAPRSGAYVATVDPSTARVISEVAEAGEQDVDAAVRAARVAFERRWSRTPPAERGKHLFRLARVLQERARELAIFEAMNTGKPIKDATGFDVPLAAAHAFHHAGWADKLPYAFRGRRWRPRGVVALVVDVDFPLLEAVSMIAPALACGNTIVLKPPAHSPLSALALARVVEAAGLPAGVVNVVTGPGTLGERLAAHPDIDALAFAGRADDAARVRRAAAGTAKALIVSRGGEVANVVFADASIDQAIDAVVGGAHVAPGPLRSAGSWWFVEEAIIDPVVQKLKDRMATLRVGPPLDKNTDVGALPSSDHLRRIEGLVAAGEREGAARHTFGRALPEGGYWFPPTLLTGASRSSRLALGEGLGPVVVVSTFRAPEEAVEKVNNTARPLSASVWTDKGSKALWAAQRLAAGTVWGNTHARFDACAPFGAAGGGLHALRAYAVLE